MNMNWLNNGRTFFVAGGIAVACVLAAVLLAGCGGGGGGGGANGSVNTAPEFIRLTITPSLGQFGEGATVKVKSLSGMLISSGYVNSSGVAIIDIPSSTNLPYLVEAGINGDQYFDEKQKSMVTINLPAGSSSALRALVPFARTDIGITPLTEIAVGIVESVKSGGISSASVRNILAASDTVYALFPYNQDLITQKDIVPILVPPTLVSQGKRLENLLQSNASIAYSQLLAGLAYLTGSGHNMIDFTYDLRDDIKDGVFDMHIALNPNFQYNPNTKERNFSYVSISDVLNAKPALSWDQTFLATTTTTALSSANTTATTQIFKYTKIITASIDLAINDAIIAAVKSFNPSVTSVYPSYSNRSFDLTYAGARMSVSQYSANYFVNAGSRVSVDAFLNVQRATRGTNAGVFQNGNFMDENSSIYQTSIANAVNIFTDPHKPNTSCSYYGTGFTAMPGHYNSYGTCIEGAPTPGGNGNISSSGGGYQCPTSKTPFDPVWIQSHGSYWAAASAHDAGLYDVEAQYCSYALSACLLIVTSSANCPG